MSYISWTKEQMRDEMEFRGKMVNLRAREACEARAQLEEALSIINDLDEYSEDVGEWHDYERIAVLRLKQ
jgi:hypothetical protein